MSTELAQVPFSCLVLKNNRNTHSHHQSLLQSLTLQPWASLSGIWLVAHWDHLIFFNFRFWVSATHLWCVFPKWIIFFHISFSSLIIYTTALLTGSNSFFSWWHSHGQIQVPWRPKLILFGCPFQIKLQKYLIFSYFKENISPCKHLTKVPPTLLEPW